MTDWGKSNRTDRFEFCFCDPFSLSETGVVDADPSASSLTWGYYTDNLYSGTITLAGEEPRKLGKDRLVRVKQVTTADGVTISKTLATMFVKECPGTAKFKLRQYKASCYSTLFRYTQDVLASDFYRAKGYNVVQAIYDLVTETGGKLRVFDGTDTSRTFGNGIWFELGTNRMSVMNTIAGWIGAQMGVDAEGYVTIGPYVEPSEKPVRYAFEAGRNCTYLPGVEEEDNRSGIVNRVVAYYTREEKDDDDAYPLTDRVCVELTEESSFSYARCGRYQTEVITLTEPCSTADLRKKATTYLNENSGEIRHYTIEHVSIPGLTVGDVVTYENDTDYDEPVFERCMIVQMDMRSLNPGAKCTTKLKAIN